MTNETKADSRKHLRDIVSGFDTAMFVTYSGREALWSRPMSIAEVDADDVLYFATDVASAKVNQVKANPKAYVLLQNHKRWASLRGSVRVLKDRQMIERLWSDAWKVWFPKGKDDPSLCLLAFDAEEGEYWDNSGANGLKYLLKAAKAYTRGARPVEDLTQHGSAVLQSR